MLKQVIALSVAAALLSGCTATQKTITPPLTNADLNSSLQVSQTVIIDAINVQNSQQTNDISALSDEIRKLKTQVSTAMSQKQLLFNHLHQSLWRSHSNVLKPLLVRSFYLVKSKVSI
jgi:uncharacterized lipoprotein YajG